MTPRTKRSAKRRRRSKRIEHNANIVSCGPDYKSGRWKLLEPTQMNSLRYLVRLAKRAP